MTVLEKFVEFALEARRRSRKLLLFSTFYVALSMAVLVLANNFTSELSTKQTIIWFLMILIATALPSCLISYWVKSPLKLIRCPKCNTAIGKRFSFKYTLSVETLIKDPEKYKLCRKCNANFSNLIWANEKSEFSSN